MPDPITYEDIHEFLRMEKQSADLEALTEETINKIREYFAAKKVLLEKQSEESGAFFSDRKLAKINDEVENAKRCIKDLYEKRERKIINRAIYTVRTESKLKDTTNMLPAEEDIYASLVESFKSHRKKFLALFRAKPQTEQTIELAKEQQKAEDAKEAEVKEEVKKVKEELKEGEVMLRFLEEVPLLVDSNLKEYGPFAIEDISKLPEELAQIIIKQGKARKVESQDI